MAVVLANLPRAGMANKILVWASARVFSNENDLKLFIFGWTKLRIGPILRSEKNFKFYLGYFKRVQFSLFILLCSYLPFIKRKYDPFPVKIVENTQNYGIYVFRKMVSPGDYFKYLRDHRELLAKEFYELFSDLTKRNLTELEPPVFGVHVRMGDFPASLRTPFANYIEIINKVRNILGYDIQVTIFSDGRAEELKELLELENICLHNHHNDLAELYLLSRSKIIIPSPASTYSYWAAFISDAIILRLPNDTHPLLRPNKVNDKNYEGWNNFDDSLPALLQNNLILIKDSIN